MVGRIKKNNEIIFTIPLHIEIDVDALNLVAFGENISLCKCKYSTVEKRHHLIYSMKELTSLKKHKLNYRETCRVLHRMMELIDYLKQNNMYLMNIRMMTDDIYITGEEFVFTYLPLKQKKDISEEDFICKFLHRIHSADIEVINLKKSLKRFQAYSQMKECMSSLIQKEKMVEDMIESSDENVSMNVDESVSESETETSLLSANCDLMPESEGETTILSEHTTAFLPNEFSECETTVLSNPQIVNDSEIFTKEGLYELYLLRVSSGEQIHINKPIYSIGKDVSRMDYVLGNASVSRNHATIYSEGEKFFLVDNGSTNGSALEGVRIREGEKVELEDGYIISLGNEVFQVLLERKES